MVLGDYAGPGYGDRRKDLFPIVPLGEQAKRRRPDTEKRSFPVGKHEPSKTDYSPTGAPIARCKLPGFWPRRMTRKPS
jgi:hypothetical protein